jgi:hypothetical protein
MQIPDTEQRQLDSAGVDAAWQSLNPHRDDPAWHFLVTCASGDDLEENLSRFYYFLRGWRRQADRFKNTWTGVLPKDRKGRSL